MTASSNRFKSYLSTITHLPEDEWDKIVDYLVVKEYSDGEMIHCQGEVFDKISFLNCGLARSYLIDHEGKDFTWSLHFNDHESNIKNLFITDYASFINLEPSQLYFEALADTEVIEIKKDDIDSLYAVSHFWANIGRMISERAYHFTHHRTLSLLSKTAKQRYKALLEENSSLLKIVPQYYIASYLGITPQSLSRIKKEMNITICE